MGALFAFEIASGAEQWSCPDSLRLITRIGDRCYVELASGDIGVCSAADGTELTRFSASDFPHIPSVPGGGILVCGDGAGNLFAVR